jgi:ribonuclease HIII
MNSIKNEALNLAKEYQKKLSRFAFGRIEEKSYNFEFSVTDQKEKIKVQIYFGKKGIKTVIQGNQNSELYNEVTSLINDQQSLPLESNPEINSEPSEYIGADESGKGDFFGPLVTAAVYADVDELRKLKAVGAVDSKLLNDSQIYIISEKSLF